MLSNNILQLIMLFYWLKLNLTFIWKSQMSNDMKIFTSINIPYLLTICFYAEFNKALEVLFKCFQLKLTNVVHYSSFIWNCFQVVTVHFHYLLHVLNHPEILPVALIKSSHAYLSNHHMTLLIWNWNLLSCLMYINKYSISSSYWFDFVRIS